MIRIAALAAVPALTLATLVAPTVAHADPKDDCPEVQIKFDKGYKSGDRSWRQKANLHIYDLCEDGAIEGTVYVKGANVKPFTPRVEYQRHNDTNYRSTNLTLTKGLTKDGWTAYTVTTDEDIKLDAGYFMGMRMRTTVTSDGDRSTKSTTCDRIHTDGDDAYLCR